MPLIYGSTASIPQQANKHQTNLTQPANPEGRPDCSRHPLSLAYRYQSSHQYGLTTTQLADKGQERALSTWERRGEGRIVPETPLTTLVLFWHGALVGSSVAASVRIH